ncbi:GNAT family N-acetyltransferase [Paenibacillus pinihumi]|uniref:GNAT family N-acetyltransferase n=1 Tax=Paenibacillus pinihumi TaxID=669462 RepID=UPI000412EE59|nr:GNAT family protein [Paenibacillus pinihumi]
MRLETARIRFRKMVSEDIPDYHKWRNDMEVMQTASLSLNLYTYAETEAFVHNVIFGAGDSAKNFIIVDKNSDQAIGDTALVQLDYKNRNAECILNISEKEYWGKGIGTEALTLLLDYAFLEMNLHRVFLRVFSFNEKAVRLYTKLGFQQEGIARQAIYRDGRWSDIIHMGILQDEYINSK